MLLEFAIVVIADSNTAHGEEAVVDILAKITMLMSPLSNYHVSRTLR